MGDEGLAVGMTKDVLLGKKLPYSHVAGLTLHGVRLPFHQDLLFQGAKHPE